MENNQGSGEAGRKMGGSLILSSCPRTFTGEATLTTFRTSNSPVLQSLRDLRAEVKTAVRSTDEVRMGGKRNTEEGLGVMCSEVSPETGMMQR